MAGHNVVRYNLCVEWVFGTATILGVVYLAAIVLAIGDRFHPPEPYVPKVPRIRRRWGLIVWVPAALFGLTMWLIVYAPVLVWRRLIRRSTR